MLSMCRVVRYGIWGIDIQYCFQVRYLQCRYGGYQYLNFRYSLNFWYFNRLLTFVNQVNYAILKIVGSIKVNHFANEPALADDDIYIAVPLRSNRIIFILCATPSPRFFPLGHVKSPTMHYFGIPMAYSVKILLCQHWLSVPGNWEILRCGIPYLFALAVLQTSLLMPNQSLTAIIFTCIASVFKRRY